MLVLKIPASESGECLYDKTHQTELYMWLQMNEWKIRYHMKFIPMNEEFCRSLHGADAKKKSLLLFLLFF